MVFVLVYQCVYLVYVVFLIYKNENLKFIQFDLFLPFDFHTKMVLSFKKK